MNKTNRGIFGGQVMKAIYKEDWINFELELMDFAEACEIKNKNNLEWFAYTLHKHVEEAMMGYAMDKGIKDYEKQY